MIFFSYFSQTLGFNISRKLSLRGKFARNIKAYFLGTIRKKIQYVLCWKFYPAYYMFRDIHLIRTLRRTHHIKWDFMRTWRAEIQISPRLFPFYNTYLESARQHTIILSLWTDRLEQSVKAQIRRRRTRRLIWVYSVCHSSSGFIDTLHPQRVKWTVINLSIRTDRPKQTASDQGLHCLPLIQQV